MNKKYLAVEVKLNINTERNIENQLEKYSFCDTVKLDKNTVIYKDDIHQAHVFVIDMRQVCIYNSMNGKISKISDLDNLNCIYDVKKLRNTIIEIMEAE